MTYFVTVDKDGVASNLCDKEEEGFIPLPDNVAYADAFMNSHLYLDGEWQRKPIVEVRLTPEEIIEALEVERRTVESAKKLAGIEFEGVMCSATRDDQDGLTAVLARIQMRGQNFKPTRFDFENGSSLVIHLGNYKAFAEKWCDFRESFYQPL